VSVCDRVVGVGWWDIFWLWFTPLFWGSAIGFLRAPFGFEAVRGAFLRLSEFDAPWTNQLITELSEEAERFARAGAPDAPLVREIKAYMRYQGQGCKWQSGKDSRQSIIRVL